MAATPIEYITRVSTLMSAAIETALPTAIPVSTALNAHGADLGLSAQVGNPQNPQFNPIGDFLTPINTIASA